MDSLDGIVSPAEIAGIIGPLVEGLQTDHEFGIKILRTDAVQKALEPLVDACHAKHGGAREQIKDAIMRRATSYLIDERLYTQATLEGMEGEQFVSAS